MVDRIDLPILSEADSTFPYLLAGQEPSRIDICDERLPLQLFLVIVVFMEKVAIHPEN